ncbi:MAG: ABC transporter substrate-binding protein [Alphaproteobacteria bacterium]
MRRRTFLLAATALSMAVSGAAFAQDKKEVKIGLLNTFSGPPAAIGVDQKNGWDLALEHLGGKLGGLTPNVLVGDDQTKPDVGLSIVDKWINQDKINFIVGPIWSNVLLAIKDTAFKAGVIIINSNAGATPMSAEQCNPMHFSTSWNNETWSEMAGEMANADGIKTAFLLAPNYQAGKDIASGFKRTYKGKFVGEIYFKLNNTDYQAEFAEVRSKKPDAIFVFAPGGMGVSLFKQWASTGLSKDIKLYSVASVDYVTLGGMGQGAVGTYFPAPFDADGKLPVNAKFVADFVAKYKKRPSYFAAQAYDAGLLLNYGIGAVKGDLTKTKDMILAMRGAKFEWSRGNVTFNTNQIPIQNWYKQTVVLKDGKPDIRTEGLIATARKDVYASKCKMPY